MTGFGVGNAVLGYGRIVVEVRTVNYRHLDVYVRLPEKLNHCSLFVEQLAHDRLSRARCEVSVRIKGAPPTMFRLDNVRARSAMEAFRRLRDEIAPEADVSLNLLATVAQLFVSDTKEFPAIRESLQKGFFEATGQLDQMREHAGGALSRALTCRMDNVRKHLKQIARNYPEALEAFRRRCRERIERLLADQNVLSLEVRWEQEIVLLAERSEICEEMTRLDVHLSSAEELLKTQGPIRKKLDFLRQEMMRETNTIGSKCQDARISRDVVEMKAELERIREQVQNVE